MQRPVAITVAVVAIAIVAMGFYALHLDNDDFAPAVVSGNVASEHSTQTASQTTPIAAPIAQDRPVAGELSPEPRITTPANVGAFGTVSTADGARADVIAERDVPTDDSQPDSADAEQPLSVPDFVFEELDPANVSAAVREAYAAADHLKYRFVRMDVGALQTQLENVAAGDAFHFELFPGEIVSPVRDESDSAHARRRDGSMVFRGGIENHPCSFFNLVISSQGHVDVRSYHRHAPIFNIALTSQDDVYAITQSTNNNEPSCAN